MSFKARVYLVALLWLLDASGWLSGSFGGPGCTQAFRLKQKIKTNQRTNQEERPEGEFFEIMEFYSGFIYQE